MIRNDDPVVAMIHLPPLPGAGNYDGAPVDDIATRALAEAELLRDAGFSWLLLQNTHDAPTRARVPAATLTAMSAIGAGVREVFGGSIGVNVHKNDGAGALAVAHAIGATFVRVKVLVGAWVGPEGLLTGNAQEVADLRRALGSDIEVWSDLGELTSVPLGEVGRDVLADWAGRFGAAHRLIVTEDDVDASAAAVAEARRGSGLPILIGGRTFPDTVGQALRASDGIIVGSCLREGNRTTGDLSKDRAEAYMGAVTDARSGR